jgi:outer membrane receptor protein involved in Fe transport
VTAFVGVNNVTDQKYAEYGVVGGFTPEPFYYPAPETNWLGGVQIAF